MRKKIALLLLSSVISFSIPNKISYADYYVDVSYATHWKYVNTHTFIVYEYGQAICVVKTDYTFIYPTSQINFLDDSVSDWDEIMIDGNVETITHVRQLY